VPSNELACDRKEHCSDKIEDYQGCVSEVNLAFLIGIGNTFAEKFGKSVE
jgi:hypothetical protein